jgi:hypothetical protein
VTGIFYDRAGVELNAEQLCDLLRDVGYQRIAGHVVVDRADPDTVFLVSTLWLGATYTRGVPKVFETMAFPIEEAQIDELTRRYTSEADALAGHTEVLAEVAGRCTDPTIMDYPTWEASLGDQS